MKRSIVVAIAVIALGIGIARPATALGLLGPRRQPAQSPPAEQAAPATADATVTTDTSPSFVAADGQFHVVGTSIEGPDGLPFVPRGVNKSGLEWTPKGYDLSSATFEGMKSWGANFVRVPLNDSYWLSSMCTYDADYASRVDQVVQWAESLHMLVLLDDHRSTRGLTCGPSGWNKAQKMADARNIEFLTQLATRYKDHPYVAFDLYNEPHDISDAVWRDGGFVDGWTAVGMQQLLDAVRSTGATNLVFASGNTWGNDLRMVADNPLRDDTNVVYAVHSYPFFCQGRMIPVSEPYICSGKQIPGLFDAMVRPVVGRRAIVITEFGTRRAIAGEVSSVIAWAEQNHVGWATYAWCSGSVADYCLLTADGSGDASVVGQSVRDALAPFKTA